MAHAAYRNLLQLLHLFVGERAGRSYHDTLAGVYAQRVEVLHRSNGEAVVVGIAYHLELNLLPSFERFLNENLRSKGECRLSKLAESLFVGADARAETSQGIG